jgi:hypothetical protein
MKRYIVKTRANREGRWRTVRSFPMWEVAERYIARQARPFLYAVFFDGKRLNILEN